MKYFIAWWVHLGWEDSLILVACMAIVVALLTCIVLALLDKQTRGWLRIVDTDHAAETGQFFAVGRDVKKL